MGASCTREVGSSAQGELKVIQEVPKTEKITAEHTSTEIGTSGTKEAKTRHTKFIIVGGVAGGATAAARIRRCDEFAEITVLEKGEFVSFANCGLPYYISGDIQTREKLLLQTPQGFWKRYRIKVITGAEVTGINRMEKQVLFTTKNGGEGPTVLDYDKLILSQGASPIVPPILGADANFCFTLRDMADMDRIHSHTASSKTAAIIGGGFIGIEMAEALVARGVKTTIIERLPQLMPPLDEDFASLVLGEVKSQGVDVILNDSLSAVDADKHEVILSSGNRLPADMVLFAVGVRPELGLAKAAGLQVGETGGLLVNDRLETNDPNIYAVGDMAEVTNRITGGKVRMPLGGPANRQGRIAGTNAAGGNKVYKGAIGSSVVKVFTKTCAQTGLSEKAAQAAKLDFGAVTVHPNHHAGYYPGAVPITLKLVYNKPDGRILGCQAWGQEGVEKRADVVATAVLGRMTLDDLEELDLCYAPPYSSANDPVNMAAFVANNQRTGFSPSITAAQFEAMKNNDDVVVVDVREKGEWDAGHLANAINVPLSSLRDNLSLIPHAKTILVHCLSGMRAHVALRCLVQRGYDRVINISGGWKSLLSHK